MYTVNTNPLFHRGLDEILALMVSRTVLVFINLYIVNIWNIAQDCGTESTPIQVEASVVMLYYHPVNDFFFYAFFFSTLEFRNAIGHRPRYPPVFHRRRLAIFAPSLNSHSL